MFSREIGYSLVTPYVKNEVQVSISPTFLIPKQRSFCANYFWCFWGQVHLVEMHQHKFKLLQICDSVFSIFCVKTHKLTFEICTLQICTVLHYKLPINSIQADTSLPFYWTVYSTVELFYIADCLLLTIQANTRLSFCWTVYWTVF